MHLQALRYLVAVAEEGHFGRAAERMHVSQPSVSEAVAKLERQYGAKLLDRSASRVTPTPAGERVLTEIRSALRHLDRSLEAVRDEPPVPLRLACTPFFAMWVTVELLTPFRVAHPDVVVSVTEMNVPAQAEALLAGEVDLAVGEPLAPHPALADTTIREDHCVIWMSQGHALTALHEIPLERLVGVPVTDGDPELHPAYHAWIRGVFARAGLVPTLAAPGRDSPSTISRIIAGTVVSLAADIVPEGGIPGIAVRRVTNDVRWRWATTAPRETPSPAALAFAAWAHGVRNAAVP